MTLGAVCELIYATGADLIVGALTHKLAFSIDDNGEKAIIYDKSKCDDYRLEKCVLAEELGHIENDALCLVRDYQNPCYKYNIDKAEAIARKAAIEKLVPLKALKKILYDGIEYYEVADFFEVTNDMAQRAVDYYKSKGKI